MPVLTAVHGDLVEQRVDAVVNAANNAMRGGSGGVNAAIHRAGGPAILQDCVARFPHGLATGDAGWTTAGDLPARWVIHTVGPDYGAGHRDPLQLASCYRRALTVADEIGARTLAFPLIGTGAYRWPTSEAMQCAVETITGARTDVEEVSLVVRDARIHSELQSTIGYHRRFRGPLAEQMSRELLRLRHEWDPAPPTDSSRFIVRERLDDEPGVVIILAESDVDYRTYHLAPEDIDYLVHALTEAQRRNRG